jgi:predicted nucleic acid-binding protein
MGLICSFDTNLLIYANHPSEIGKYEAARNLMDRLLSKRPPIAGQVLGEFLRVVHRKAIMPLPAAREIVQDIEILCPIAETRNADRLAASLLAEQYKLQFFDALICAVLEKSGVSLFLSEDMQDGRVIADLTILNPFNPANALAIAAALA